MLILNCKNYILKNISQDNFIEGIKNLQDDMHIDFGIIPSIIDLQNYIVGLKDTKINVISPHIDFINSPKTTGYISEIGLQNIGCNIALLNHSEHRILDLNNIVEKLSNLNLQFIWCFNDYDIENNLELLKQIYQLKNNLYIAYEPSDLIGGQNGSVIENKKQMLELLCTNFDSKRILLGAGIQSEEDFRILYQSNFAGALLSSIVMNDENPLERLKELYTFEKMYNSSCK